MANTVSMIAPVGFTGSVSVNVSTPPSSGQTYTPNASGQVLVDPRDVIYMLAQGFLPGDWPTEAKIATADDGTTQTLTAAMISGGSQVIHVTTGGATPSLTLPLASALATAAIGMSVGDSYMLRVINTNSGTATIVTNTGWTTSGTLTLVGGAPGTATFRDFVITKTGAATFSITSVGTGLA